MLTRYRRYVGIILLGVMMAFTLSACKQGMGSGGSGAKIAVVDPQMLKQAPEVLAMAQVFVKKIQPARVKMQGEYRQMMTVRQQISQTKSTTRRSQLIKRFNTMRAKFVADSQKLRQMQIQHVTKMRVQINAAVKKVAKQKGYDFVLQKNSMYYANGHDITKQVIKNL